jgi:amidophosphoribosyltransferase
MCGILGFTGNKKVVGDLIYGLLTLQHRGQDSAGIITFDRMFHIKKGKGLVSEVFNEKHYERLRGNTGLGHVRYTTHGSNTIENAQPVYTNFPFGIAMVHNGNVTNFKEMNRVLYEDYHVLPTSTNDVEILLYTFAAELKNKDLKHLSVDDIFDAVRVTQQKVEGAYAVIAVIANHGLLAFMDPSGIRPLVLGKKETGNGTVYGLASENVTFDHLGYKVIRDLQPGEIIFIDNNQQVHSTIGYQRKHHFCVFEYIYFAREDAVFHGSNVAGKRVRLGQAIARQIKNAGLTPDVVIDVPSSGYFAASGLAEALGVPHHRGLVKSSYIGRSFIAPEQKERENIVHRKLNPIKKAIRGKKVAVVDDSIVRGTTSKRIVEILRNAGAKEVYFVSAAPPIKHPCVYGIDMSIDTELIANRMTIEEIKNHIGADALFYFDLKELPEVFNKTGICDACFTGDYPTPNVHKILDDIIRDRKKSKS